MKPVKKWIKVALDAVLFVLLVLMYRKQAVSMAFHEIGGLALIALFVVHHLFNGRWIAAVTRKLFSAKTPVKARVCYAVDALLLVAFLCIGVSGALISKTVFSFNLHGGAWKTLHYFCSALALALIGVHIGLHAAYLFGALKRRGKLVRIAAAAVTVAMLGAGVYHLATTSYFRWLSMPFSASAIGGGNGQGRGGDAFELPEGATLPEGLELPDGMALPESGERPEGFAGAGNGNGGGKGKGNGSGQGNGAGPGAGMQGGTFRLGNALTVLFQFATIASVFAAVACGVERLTKRLSKGKFLRRQRPSC